MGRPRIFVTWPMEPAARAILEAAGDALDQVVLTPHIGSASRATRLAMATRAAENCVAALRGERPPDLMNPDAWGSPPKV